MWRFPSLPRFTRSLNQSADKMNKGFTAIELYIVLGLAILLLSIGLPVAIDFYLSYQLVSQTELLSAAMQQARNLAMVNFNGSKHGVRIDADQFTIFQGESYAVRDPSQDKVFSGAAAITVNGPSEIVFENLSGRTSSSTWNLIFNTRSRWINVNEEGLVEY